MRVFKNVSLVSHFFFINNSVIFTRVTNAKSSKIKQILQTYKNSSKQKINFNMSAVTFNSNTHATISTTIQTHLGVKKKKSRHDRYLKLPTVKRNQRDISLTWLETECQIS